MENNKNISVIAGIVILIIVAYFIGQHSKNFNSTAIATSTTEQAVITNATSSQESENLEVLHTERPVQRRQPRSTFHNSISRTVSKMLAAPSFAKA